MNLSLFKNRTFTLFFLGNSISLFGWGLNFIAVSWIIIEKTGSELALGKINAIAVLPGVLIALYAGTIIDRMNRKHLLVTIDLYRMIVVLTVPLLIIFNQFELWHLYVMSFLTGFGSSIFWPCASAFLQELLPEKDYLAGNSLLSASYQSGTLIGSAAGGFIIHLWGPETALIIDAFTYLSSATLIGLAQHKSAPYLQRTESMFDTFKAGFRYIRKNQAIFGYGISATLADVAIWGCFAILSIVFSIEILDAGAKGFGLIDGAYGMGALLSTFIAIWITTKLSRKKSLIIAYLIAGLCSLFLPVFPSLLIAMLLYFVMGINNNSARIISRTILMENIPNDVIGRVNNILGIITRVLVILSTIIIGWVAESFSITIALIITTCFFWFSLFGVLIANKIKPSFFVNRIYNYGKIEDTIRA